jgi:hypothetical protein
MRDKRVMRTPGVVQPQLPRGGDPWRKVAGFDYHSGIFWERLTIETRGQAARVIGCLSKRDGRRIRDVLRALEG